MCSVFNPAVLISPSVPKPAVSSSAVYNTSVNAFAVAVVLLLLICRRFQSELFSLYLLALHVAVVSATVAVVVVFLMSVVLLHASEHDRVVNQLF